MKIYYTYITILGLFLFWCIPNTLFAASIFTSGATEVKEGQTFEVALQVDTDNVSINSVDIALTYDPHLISFSGYKNDGTVINLWLHAPYESNGRVYMDGIIPGGVSGLYDPKKETLGAVTLARLLFTAKKSGNATFAFTKSEILKNDGKGTPLTHQEEGSAVSIITSDVKVVPVADTEKPQPFIASFIDASLFSRTPPMIAFQAFDLESGIKEYQMNIDGLGWQVVTSPQTIQKRILSRTVTVRALDFSGNFTEAEVVIPGLLSIQVFSGSAILLFVFCFLAYRVIRYRR